MTEPSSTHYPFYSSEQLNKRFYNQFKSEHAAALRQLHGASNEIEGQAYITTLLLRLMVLFFLQAQGLLDNDPHYLWNRLQFVQQHSGPDCFFREYLLPLFTTLYTGQPTTAHHSSGFGHLPRVDIPLFQPEALELRSPHLTLLDATFFRLFSFLHSYQWQIDHQSIATDEALQPSILAYIFEQHSDQKQTGTYYTQEDIALYITGYTVLPRLFSLVAEDQPEDLGEHAPCWQLLSMQPDRYISAAIQTTNYLPEENEREYIQRQQRYRTLFDRLQTGSIHDIVDLTTDALDLQRFVMDILLTSQKLAFLQTFLQRLQQLTILDPTCGSGAFLLAAVKILQPLYMCCLECIDILTTEQTLKDDTISFPQKQERTGTQALVQPAVEFTPTRHVTILRTMLSSNLYGVDLSPAACEICRLRLYLALLSGITRIEDVPLLDTLSLNIRAGNALVGETLSSIHSPVLPILDEQQTTQLRQPFHWQNEFPRIFSQGGFDVIIGNPPYLEHSKIRHEYAIHGYEEKSCGNIYAAVIERSLALCKTGQSQLGLIVPISICGAQRFAALRQHLLSTGATFWLANFEIFPCRLFEGAFQRLSILLVNLQNRPKTQESRLFVTRIHRWYSAERPYLLSLLSYTQVRSTLTTPLHFPKLAAARQEKLLDQIRQHTHGTDIGKFVGEQRSSHFIYYQEATNYWTKAVCHIPFYKKNGIIMTPPHGRLLFFADRQTAMSIMALLNSSLFYVWFATYSDGFHLSHALVKSFPLCRELVGSTELATLAERLEEDIQQHARLSTRNTQRKESSGHLIELAEYYMRFSKPIMDEIDHLLAAHFNFTPEDLDFVLHYDAKHRITRQRKK